MKQAVIRCSARSSLAALTALCLLTSGPAAAQTGTERTQGLRDNTPRWHAITQARLVLAPGRVVEDGTLVMKDGVIVAAGAGVAVPAGARVWALAGRTVYAGFIDLASPLGLPAALRPAASARPGFGPFAALLPPVGPRPAAPAPTARGLAARNARVRAEQDVAQQIDWKADEVRAARELGFTTVLSAPANGVFRGQSALLALGAPDSDDPKSQVIASRVAQHLAFESGGGRETYPTSLMGAIALQRQTLLDAHWQGRATLAAAAGSAGAAGERIEPNATLQALLPVLDGRQPVIHVADDEQDYLRIARLRDEFKLRSVVQGNGYEYRRAAQLRALALPVIVPLAYPARPEIDNPDSALDVSLAALQHWEQAPSNLALIERAGVSFAVTAAGLRDARREFWPRLRQAVRRGLPAERALAGLTTVPAGLVGEAARLGTLEPGRMAHLVVARGDLFTSDEAEIELTFVDGRPLPTEAAERADPRGSWAVDGSAELLQISGTRAAPRLQRDGNPCELAPRGSDWVLRLPCGRPEAPGAPGAGPSSTIVAQLRGERWSGTVQVGDGPLQPWSARRTAAAAPAPAASAAVALAAADAAVKPPAAHWPAGALGTTLPEQPAVVVLRNATVWTVGPAGTLARADVLLRAGKVAAVGPDLAAPPGVRVIDATGKHITPGLIDAHSHIAMARGINESSHSVTAEVRVADVVDATDMTIYRQLAGGTTAANVLHGSANTIGGQNQVIKLRWGGDAALLAFEGAQPGIKFALGENVKRSNFGPGTRYPGTRMGVEQVLRDAFAAAEEYAAEWKAFRAARGGARLEPRRDLQLETLVELLERRRAIHVHSYRADEILMFARFAKDRKLEVAAFQHVLEGYKVADEMAAIGAGGSTFSDWWAYKMEVADAIPHNAALMSRAGVLTTLNSDSNELGRRMNTEAAKAVKYGGLEPGQALALVTLNAARQLGVAARTGSLEPGKDADLVVWSGPPMATTSRVEQTWIDGRRYFDLASDASLRERDAAERARLVTAALRTPRPPTGAAGERGAGGGAAPPGAAAPARPTFTDGLAWFRLFDQARAFRHSYADQGAWHECTEDAP
ncbi:Amidohydrolase [Rubrivivax sp. A210]|uniref:amidohydrolase family protein n=1 Tax=Rubrivivax sp. A210 TaxID=2772301 RepID=UPI001919B9D4|nr:amidohydrolase family protein [Rubrivivax sp. A210]CAD5367170.1 Amidohydrolase [Rubrivivax sp. A210]